MSRFHDQIRPAVQAEIDAASRADARGEAVTAFGFLERAHVLAQSSTWLHVRVHLLMLRWAIRQHRSEEIAGQLLRVVSAACKTAIGLVPRGNTGGTNVSALRRMPIPADLQQQIDAARR